MEGLHQGVVVELSTMVASRVQNVKVDGLQELTLWVGYYSRMRSRIDFTILESQREEQHVM